MNALHVAIAVFVIGLAAVAGVMDADVQLANDQFYCDMVELNVASKGQYGWPDYNRSFNELCKSRMFKNEEKKI